MENDFVLLLGCLLLICSERVAVVYECRGNKQGSVERAQR